MKKLKRAIANFIIEGKDCWDKLDENESEYILNCCYLDYQFYFDDLLNEHIRNYNHITINEMRLEYCEEKLRELMPCFFEE